MFLSPKTVTVAFFPLVLFISMAGCGPAIEEAGMLEEAEALIKQLDYNEAGKRFALAREFAEAGTEDWVRSSYGLMLSKWHSSPANAENINGAVTIAEELLSSDAVEPSLRLRITLDLARIEEIADFQGDDKDLDKARELYREVQANTSHPEIAYEAMLRLANTYRKEISDATSREAESIILEHLENNPEVDHWTSMAWQVLGEIRYTELNDSKGALEAYEEALERGFVNRNQNDQYYWSMANWAEEIGMTDRAIELYTAIAAEMPRSTYQTLARLRIVELGGTPPAKQHLL